MQKSKRGGSEYYKKDHRRSYLNKGKLMESYYNIHNIVELKLVDETKLLNKLFNDTKMEYVNFISEEKINNPHITIYFGKFKPSIYDIRDCFILDGKYYVKEDYFYCEEDSYKKAKWRFELRGFESGCIEARISYNIFGGMFISNVVDPLIQFKMNEEGFPVVHASCVSIDNSAFLFSGRSGSGKTTLALNLAARGFGFLGDDFSILHNSQVLGFLSPLNIFKYNLAPIIEKRLGIKGKALLSLRSLLYKVTLGYVKIFMKMNPKDILPNSITSRAKLDSVFILMPKGEFKVESISKDKAIEHLVINQKLDNPYFLKYISEYSYIFPESRLGTYWVRYRENLERNLAEDVAFYKVEVPQKYGEEVFKRIVEIIRVHKEIN
jgi:hypothetical protein